MPEPPRPPSTLPYDLLALLGAGTVAVGIGLIHVPAGVIAAGLLAVALGLLGGKRGPEAGA